MSTRAMPLVVGFDTETTGLDVNRDEAISYGFAVFRDGVFHAQDSHQFFVIPHAPLHPKAAEIHGISLHALEDGQVPGEVHDRDTGTERAVQTLLDFARHGALFVGANPKYDLAMLVATMQRHPDRTVRRYIATIPRLQFHDVIDTHAQQHQTRRRSLKTLCEIHDVTPGNHDALGDARASVEVFFRQREHHQPVTRVDLGDVAKRNLLQHTWSVLTRSGSGRL
jgi:DNA polymerase III epsilon subunit-like protein